MTWVAGLLGGAAATWAVRAIARRLGIVAKPNPIVPQHQKPTAYLGGVGIALGFALVLAAGRLALDRLTVAFVVPAAGYLALGLVDDLKPLRAWPKLVVQTALAALAVALGAGARVTGIAALDAAFAVMWMVLLVNAVNVTDVCDGLAGGMAAIGLLTLGWLAPSVRPAAWGLAGACVGFLVFNRPPASIFMGDAGSLLLGFALAAFSLPVIERAGPWPGVPMALAASAWFVFEVALLIYVRRRKGLPFWKGSPDHFSLRMQAAGWSKWRTVMTTWAATAAVCAIGVWLPALPLGAQIAAAALLGVVAWASATWLLRHEVRREPAAQSAPVLTEGTEVG
jgi:UDP-GlcNAc:undecaprenyl-phosphate GlcNAc-1-phosphate transferase